MSEWKGKSDTVKAWQEYSSVPKHWKTVMLPARFETCVVVRETFSRKHNFHVRVQTRSTSLRATNSAALSSTYCTSACRTSQYVLLPDDGYLRGRGCRHGSCSPSLSWASREHERLGDTMYIGQVFQALTKCLRRESRQSRPYPCQDI